MPPSDPVSNVRWVPIAKIEANGYNPNTVAKNEMRLLYLSIKEDGYTQPIVTYYDTDRDVYVIVDGFHRYMVGKNHADINIRTEGLLPVVVIDKDINHRMSSTIRHNRARGKHQIGGMAGVVFSMLDNGWDEERICSELGLESDELIRLKYVTGFAKLFEDVEYRRAWETNRQVMIRREYQPTNG
jgi:ParB-like chromosome segregation protein Spo0J